MSKRLGELVDLAYERELAGPLDGLRDSLDEWKSGAISADEMRKRVR